MNPTVGSAFLEHERARDPENFRAEYEAEFLAGGAAFLNPERIEAAIARRHELAPEQGAGWIAGLDPAFSSDPFGLVLVGREPVSPALQTGTIRVGLARRWVPARRRSASFDERRAVEDAVLAEVAGVCRYFNARAITDQYVAPAVVDALRREGVNVRSLPMTATTKTLAFTELRARLESGSLELYEEQQLLAELRRLRTRYTAGQATVINPRVGNSHGDLAQALALAVYEHDRTGSLTPSNAHAEAFGTTELRRALGALEPIRYDETL